MSDSSSPLTDDERRRLVAEIKADMAALVSKMESRIEQVEAERDRLRDLLALAEAHVSRGSSLRPRIREALSGVATTTHQEEHDADGQ